MAIPNALQRNTITNVKKTRKLSPLCYCVIELLLEISLGFMANKFVHGSKDRTAVVFTEIKKYQKKEKKKKNWKYVIDNKFFCKLSLNHRD